MVAWVELVMIRHGRPERIDHSNRAADPHLTATGHQQAKLLADWLATEQIDAVYVSPMARARQTAAPLENALGTQAIIEDRIREFDHASNAYIPVEEAKRDREFWQNWVVAQQSYDLTSFADAVSSAISEIVTSHRGQRVALVCHGGVINMVAARFLGMADKIFFNPNYTSVNRFLAASSGERSVSSLNEIGHLREAPHLVLY